MKFKNGFVKEHIQTQENHEEQKRLKEKHGIESENAVVEKSFFLKFIRSIVGKIIST
jgi:hypothetical protein